MQVSVQQMRVFVAHSVRMCYKHDRGKRGGGGYAPESSVQKLYTPV